MRLLLCKLLTNISTRVVAIGSEALLSPYLHEFVMALYVRPTPMLPHGIAHPRVMPCLQGGHFFSLVS